jgi:hypothetical protein
VPTDRDGLLEKYEGIPYPTDAYNDVELSKALLDSIKIMNIKVKNGKILFDLFFGVCRRKNF